MNENNKSIYRPEENCKSKEKIYVVVSIIAISIIIIVGGLLLILPLNDESAMKDTGRIWEERDPIIKEAVRIPNEEDLNHLEETCDKVLEHFSQKDVTIEKIREIYNEILEIKTCRKANKKFKLLDKEYNSYLEQLSEIKKYISEFEEEYEAYINMLDSIPSYSRTLREEKDLEFERIRPKYEEYCIKKQEYEKDEKEAYEKHLAAKKIADDFFEEYYELLCKLVNAEAGGSTKEDQWCVMGVVENRVEHPEFKYYTVYDVVYAPGQYAPTWDGGMEKIPTQGVRRNVEEYLRGEGEFEMPSNVTYQAKFTQGSGVWKYIEESGHYYCYD